jgi:eukaryotic-like serine/threonine-protein kinase
VDLGVGLQLGDYVLEAELGRGSMGAVFRARHVTQGGQFAVKVLLDALASDMTFVTRFTREARIIAGLRHPNIIRVYEAGRQGQYLYFVMEYFPGVTVGSLLKERTRLPVAQVVEIAAQAADALDYAHAEGRVVHRDIKPENLLVDRWCRVKMLDFGLARVEGLHSITRAGTVVGSLYYVAPEQLLGQPVDGRADIYALGVSMYEMMTGQRPFRGQTLTDMSRAILAGTPTLPSALEPSVTPEVERIILRALARDPTRRYGRARELCDDLRAVQAALAPRPLPPVGPEDDAIPAESVLTAETAPMATPAHRSRTARAQRRTLRPTSLEPAPAEPRAFFPGTPDRL